MKTITLDELQKKFGKDFPCRVWYRNRKEYVSYQSSKHVNWKNVGAITVLFPEKKVHVDNGERVSRDGVHYRLK